jgi:quercetin dioxygenase-like cupin family protein
VKHINYLEEKPEDMKEAGAHGIKLRWVIGEKDGAPNFFMRVVTFDKVASSPSHSHPWEHEVFVLSGKGVLEVDGKEVQLKAGDVAYVPPNAHHCFKTQEPMEMI